MSESNKSKALYVPTPQPSTAYMCFSDEDAKTLFYCSLSVDCVSMLQQGCDHRFQRIEHVKKTQGNDCKAKGIEAASLRAVQKLMALAHPLCSLF